MKGLVWWAFGKLAIQPSIDKACPSHIRGREGNHLILSFLKKKHLFGGCRGNSKGNPPAFCLRGVPKKADPFCGETSVPTIFETSLSILIDLRGMSRKSLRNTALIHQVDFSVVEGVSSDRCNSWRVPLLAASWPSPSWRHF